MADATLSSAEDVAQFLEDQGAGTLNTDLFINLIPSSPPSTAFSMVKDTGGFDPQPSVVIAEQTTVQVIVKGAVDDPQGARLLAQTILQDLKHSTFTSAAGTFYDRLVQHGRLSTQGDDDNRRPQFGLNFRMFRAYD